MQPPAAQPPDSASSTSLSQPDPVEPGQASAIAASCLLPPACGENDFPSRNSDFCRVHRAEFFPELTDVGFKRLLPTVYFPVLSCEFDSMKQMTYRALCHLFSQILCCFILQCDGELMCCFIHLCDELMCCFIHRCDAL